MTARPWHGAGRRVYLQEVGTRDGLQAEAQFVPTPDKKPDLIVIVRVERSF